MNENISIISKVNHTNSETDHLFNKIKRDLFKRIFLSLDKDNDDSISIFNADLKSLTPDVLEILDPVILKLKMEKYIFNKQNFIEYCEMLFDVIFK